MAISAGDPPPSTDLEGWRQAIAGGRLRKCRLETIAAAFQDLGETDLRVREDLAKHLSGAIMGMLRKRVDTKKPNGGEDIIFEVHEIIFVALLTGLAFLHSCGAFQRTSAPRLRALSWLFRSVMISFL